MNQVTPNSQNAFVAWAKENAVAITSIDTESETDDSDLKAIASAIGEDVQIVALSEGCHNSKQMMSLHHRIVKYLISHCGFTIVATESGLPESKLVFDYVQNNEKVDNVETSLPSMSIESGHIDTTNSLCRVHYNPDIFTQKFCDLKLQQPFKN